MSLTPGSRLGVYDITAPLGEGGMGQVWRATDTTLGRQVAIKILPEAFAADPDRLARFEREAKTLASLNHPHIAAIYGFEKSSGTHALVMELVEGEDLSQRIARGAIPLDEAMPIAKQIAEALEAAHEQGIIHRDLKPANIKVRPDGTVKVLDFGLAKALQDPKTSGPQDLVNSPTITSPAMTQAGMILGTAAYMSPEQAKGRTVDKRSDVWAFAAVLYEMLTGRRAFEGEDVSDTLARILMKEPDWTAVPATVPAAVVTVMRRCLQKDRKQRVRDIGDVSLALEGAFETAAPSAGAAAATPAGPALRRWILAAVSLALVASAATAAIAWMLRPSAPPAAVTRFSIALGEGQSFTNTGRNTVAISPDGTTIVYVANEQLYLRSLSTREARPIAGTNLGAGVMNPVFSPDGRAVAFFSAKDNTLKRIDVNGGVAVTLCPATAPHGMSWDASGIVFGQNPGGILRVSANGGTPEVLVSVKDDEIAHGPQLLPGGEAILFTLATRANPSSPVDWDQAAIVAQRLGAAERRVVIAGASDARSLPTGHLVYAVDGVVFGVRFDAQRLEAVGAPTPVVEGVRRGGSGIAHLDISSTGTLAYVPGPVSSDTSALRSLAFVDGAGNVEVVKLKAGAFVAPRISPDGTRVAYGSDDEKDANIWVYPLSGAAAPQKLPGAGARHAPIWAGNERVAFQSEQDKVGGIFWQRADGTGTVERVTTAEAGTSQVPESWSPQSETLLYAVRKDSRVSLRTLSVRDKKDAPFGRAEASESMDAVFSPDGRWVAYDVAGRIYVAPFPPTDEPREGPEAGRNPFWSGDGKQLFYGAGDGRNQLFGVVTFSATPTPVFGIPSTVPRSGLTSSGPQVRRNYDRDPRSDRILGVLSATSVDQTTGAATEPAIEVVLGWFEELKRLVPIK